MASGTQTIPMSDVTKNMTCEVKVTGVELYKFRCIVAALLFKLAAWIIGMKVKVIIGKSTVGEFI